MRKFFTFVARFLASIFAILFVITAAAALLLSTLGRQLFTADLYKQALAEEQIYERLPIVLAEMIATPDLFNPCARNPVSCEELPPELRACFEQTLGNERYAALATNTARPTEAEELQIQACIKKYPLPEETAGGDGEAGGMPPFFKNLKVSDWEAVLRTVLPPLEMQAMTEEALDQIFSYLNGETSAAVLSLIPLRNRLAGSAGEELITLLIHAQPECTPQELAQIRAGAEGEEVILCNPPDEETFGKMVLTYKKKLNQAVGQIPDQATIIKPPKVASTADGPIGGNPVKGIRMIRLILLLSPLPALVFLLLVTFFGVRSLKGWMRWWGIPFFFTGLIGLGGGVLAVPAFEYLWAVRIAVSIPSYLPPAMAEVGHDLVRAVIHGLSERIVLQALLLGGVGLIAWVVSAFIRTRLEE